MQNDMPTHVQCNLTTYVIFALYVWAYTYVLQCIELSNEYFLP